MEASNSSTWMMQTIPVGSSGSGSSSNSRVGVVCLPPPKTPHPLHHTCKSRIAASLLPI